MSDKSKILFMLSDGELHWKDFLKKNLPSFECCFTTSADNVLEQVFDAVPHLLVIDEDFKNGEGKEIAFQVKEDGILRYIPIILLIANESRIFKEKDKAIDYFAHKDDDREKLLHCVRQALSENTHELDLNPLTRLPGTRSSLLRIERIIHSGKSFAVCCVDLSHLSVYNNVYGDARGDEIIITAGRIIEDVLKKEGASDHFIGHLGGDDFVIVTDPDRAARISETLIKGFDDVALSFYDESDRRKGYLVQKDSGGQLNRYPIMKISVVVLLSDGSPKTEMSEIGRIAGEIKKYMKAFPESGYIEYHLRSPETPDESGESHLEIHLPTKMKNVRIAGSKHESERTREFFTTLFREKGIRTVYQPIVEFRSKKIVGYEALTRSLDDNFFKDAELLFSLARETGHVKQLDLLCVETALETAQKLPAGKKLFLNLNHETLMDSKTMKELFHNKGIIGFKNIVIEITEQSILRSFREIKDSLLELKEQGVCIAIDDVGGGAVSLRDVAVLKPDYIKFDRSLIRQINANITKQQIVLSMILFAKGIHAITTAEGIETQEELQTLMMCGVELGQGFYLARPGSPFPKLSRGVLSI